MEGLPVEKVASKHFRKNSCLSPISQNTFTKYMGLATKQLEADITALLPDKFALVFDGWTHENAKTHYMAMFASFTDTDGKPVRCLLSFSPFKDETSYTAKDHKRLIKSVLKIFTKTLEDVVCLVGDNCSVNQKLAKECDLPFIGCAAHRFNLEVQKYLERHKIILDKVLLSD